MVGYVYFIESGFNGPIKIGFATDPYKRLRTLQTGNPTELHLLAKLPGTSAEEHALHERFDRYRLGFEWFAPVASLWAIIDQHWCYDEAHGTRPLRVVLNG